MRETELKFPSLNLNYMVGKTIYLITKTVGEYEDRFTEIIKAKITKESAEKFVSDQIEKYDSISEINESWNNWVKGLWKLVDPEKIQKTESGEDFVEDDVWEDTIEIYMGKEDNFIEYLKTYFPDDFKKFGEDKLRFAFDLEERGQLDERAWYDIEEIIIED